MTARVLDPCCGSRMMWFDKQHPGAIFGDQRRETITVTDNSRGNASGTRVLRIEPDVLLDFRALPFPDATFTLVAFDPPHLVHAGPRSWLAAKYGRLSGDWRDDLRAGFSECFRVLEAGGRTRFQMERGTGQNARRAGPHARYATVRPAFRARWHDALARIHQAGGCMTMHYITVRGKPAADDPRYRAIGNTGPYRWPAGSASASRGSRAFATVKTISRASLK